jgi:hypothetical protein
MSRRRGLGLAAAAANTGGCTIPAAAAPLAAAAAAAASHQEGVEAEQSAKDHDTLQLVGHVQQEVVPAGSNTGREQYSCVEHKQLLYGLWVLQQQTNPTALLLCVAALYSLHSLQPQNNLQPRYSLQPRQHQHQKHDVQGCMQ